MSEPTSSPTAGWYPNPEGEGLRWWDGAAWTENVHVELAPTPAPTPEPAPAPTPPASSPPPGVASTPPGSLASTPPAAGQPVADGGPRRIFGVRPAILIALLVVILAAFLLPEVIFDDEPEPVESAPAPTPRGDPDIENGRKSGGVEQGGGTTLLALEIEPGSYLITDTSTTS